ncbi:hypothetical protein PoB_003833500 [Plakobranchus ocellatus]|uniref:Uncharacterized protein n=1 Tax=Plakobranchus ocellatus TaxID=259542 RepID=A0AAV4AU11_9GAST|nr:hypothetical protein PoB_003833500 [Plakobranchus ocellatus]
MFRIFSYVCPCCPPSYLTVMASMVKKIENSTLALLVPFCHGFDPQLTTTPERPRPKTEVSGYIPLATRDGIGNGTQNQYGYLSSVLVTKTPGVIAWAIQQVRLVVHSH